MEEPQTVPSRQPKHPPRCMGSGRPGVCSPCNDLRPKPTPSKAPESAAFLKALRPLLETQAPGSLHCFPEEPCSTHGSPPASQDKHLLDFRLLEAWGGLGPGAARRKQKEISLPASGIGLKHPAKANTCSFHCWGSYGCWPNTARARNPGGRAPIRTRGLLRGGSHRPAHAQGLPTQQGLYPSAVPMLLMVPPSPCHKQIPVPQADPQIPPMDPHQAALRQRGSDTRGLGTEGRGLSRNASPSSSSE